MPHNFFHVIAASFLGLLSTLAVANPLQIVIAQGPTVGTINVELTNTGQDTLSILRWDTPFEATLSDDVFQITTSAKALPFTDAVSYIGRHAKRAAPSEENFLTLTRGESRVAAVQLAEYYDIQEQDLYRIRYVGEIQYVVASKKLSKNAGKKLFSQTGLTAHMDHQTLISNEVSVMLSSSHASSRILPPAYSGCSVNQQANIQSAAQSAESLTSTAISDLQSLTTDERATSPRYSTWFGTYTTQRYNQVLSNFQSISSTLANETIRYDCTCEESGVYAYVYPIRPYNVFLCPSFYASDELGTDSRAGTIIHELSHFTIVAGTEDFVYSQQGAQSLAISDPAKAIDNADSHEYFAENTPFIAIRSDNSTQPVTQFAALPLNTPLTGNVSKDMSDFYQVNNADSVTLISNSGNADLFVSSNPQMTQVVCRSQNIGTDDQCELFSEGTLYIEVYGFDDSEYTLQATGQITEPPETIPTLVSGSPLSGSIAKDDRAIFQVTGANLINLESVSGDADLYVFSTIEFTDTSLVCTSILSPPENSNDTCVLPDTDSRYYIMIVGWTDAQYILTATATEVDPTPQVILTPFGDLSANQPVSRAIDAQAAHAYTASGLAVFELTSLTGDADLLIFDGPILEGGELICISEEFSSNATLDRCDVSSSNSRVFEVAVFGYSDSDYSLLALSADTTDPVVQPDPVLPSTNPDDQTPVEEIASSGSGGSSLSIFWLIVGLSMLGLRCRRTQRALL